MFELEVNHDRVRTKDLPEEAKNHFLGIYGGIQGVAIIPWEEHCTECAMPMCYETCDLYEPRKDGKCRRFIGGIATIPNIPNIQNYVVRIAFKRWGQLMAYANIHMIPVERAKHIERLIYAIDGIISRIPDQNISILGRRSVTSRLTRRLKQSIAANGYLKSRQAVKPDYFLIEIYNPNTFTVNLSFTISDRDPDSYVAGYQKLLELKEGFNRFKIDSSEIYRLVDLNKDFAITLNPNIVNKEDEGLCLYFGMVTFIWDSDFKNIKHEENNDTGNSYIKVVAWDLDNTIWDGILIEDGINNIKIKPGVIDIIKQLDRRGILNTVVSKNNPDDALAYLKTVGLLDYILHPMIGWGQKGQYLKALVKQFNVGENTFAFIDDSPFERDQAISINPQIRTYDAKLYNSLLDYPEFSPPISTESHIRRDLYKVEINRENVFSAHDGDYLSFLKECKIILSIYTPTSNNLDRIQELVQRTNQLNFSGNRYQRDKIQNILENAQYDSFCLDCNDKYGQYGTVGFAIVDNHEGRLIDLMLSCRIQSKRVEHAFLAFLLSYYKNLGYKLFSASFNQTDRNKKAGAVFDDMGFNVSDIKGPLRTYEFRLETPIPTDKIIQILWNGKECPT